jgi:multicomponent Na+:H+ antiporter subunit B
VFLRTIARSMFPVLLLFSFFLLLRGHNLPGGGFVGGLVAAAALILQLVTDDEAAARRVLHIDPLLLLPIGLALALGSGLLSVALGLPFMTSRFVHLNMPIGGELEFGLPTLFDMGVYAVVLGVVLLIVFNLAEE